MKLRENISNKLHAFSTSIVKEIVYRVVIFVGIALTGYGIYLQDLAIVISGAALITASVIGIVMSMQTSKIARTIYERFDKQDELADIRHKEIMNNHKETMSVLNKIVDVLERIEKSLEKIETGINKIDKKLDQKD